MERKIVQGYCLISIITFGFASVMAQSFVWPVDPHPIGQYYAAYNKVASNKYHAGMDIGDGNYNYTTTVKAVHTGTIHKIFGVYSLPSSTNLRRWNSSNDTYSWDAQPTTDRLGQTYGTDNHGLGICVIIYHSDLQLYTLYGHMDAVVLGLTPGQNISAGTPIGKMGNSNKQYLRRSRTADGTPPTPQGSPPPGYLWSDLIIADASGFRPHVHFETKDRGVLSARRTDEEPDYGYTPGPSPGSIEKSGHPNFWGYHDPNIFLTETVTKLTQLTPVEVLQTPLNVRDYPSTDSSLSLVITRIGSRGDAHLPAFVATRSVGDQWYQVFLPNAETEGWSASGWIAGNLGGTIYSQVNNTLAQVKVTVESARLYASATTSSSTLAFVYGQDLLEEQRFVPFESLSGWYRIFTPQKASQADGWILASVVTYIPSSGIEILVPVRFLLNQNYPNPFNSSTSISFSLPIQSFVSLKVYDGTGREVVTVVSEYLPAGSYTKQWNANGLPSGSYFYRLTAGSFTETKKLILLR